MKLEETNMIDLLKVTADEIVSGYKARGLKPRVNHVSVESGGCCALGILFPDCLSTSEVHRRYSQIMAGHFGAGFDYGLMNRAISRVENEYFMRGHMIGVACRAIT